MLKLVFFGTPEFAVPALNLLLKASDIFKVLAVVTQPDRPVGRKQLLTPPPVKLLAERYSVPVFQPERLSEDNEVFDKISGLKADCLVTVAYGQILKTNYLNLTPLGVINLHASLLPKYRGPAPINWMLINGEKQLGVSTMLSDSGVDTGPILLRADMDLIENETAVELSSRMSVFGAELLLKTLSGLNAGAITSFKQSGYDDLPVNEQLAPFLSKELGYIDFSKEFIEFSSPNPRQSFFNFTKLNSAENIHNLVRGLYSWPGAYFLFKGEKIAIIKTTLIDLETLNEFRCELQADKSFQLGESLDVLKPLESYFSAGTIMKINYSEGYIWVMTRDGLLQLDRLKPSGKNEMKASDCLNGLRLKLYDSL